MAGDRTQEKVLVEMVAPRKIVAADQVGIFAFEIERRPDRSGQHEAAQARRVRLQDVEHAFGIGFLRIVPVRRANLALGVAANLGWQDADLHPEDMLAFRSARRIDRGRLADDQRGLDGKQSDGGFGIDPRHHFKVRRNMDVGELFEGRAGAPVGQRVERKWIIMVPGPARIADTLRSNVLRAGSEATSVPNTSFGCTLAITARRRFQTAPVRQRHAGPRVRN